MKMDQNLLQMMSELADDSDVMGAIGQAAPSRSRNQNSRISIGGSGGVTQLPAMAAQYLGESQAQSEAADDGTQGPVAAKSHALAYMNDPQWQHWDQMRSKAVDNMKGGGGFWGWATGGRYNAALGQEAQNADYMARQIERRYLDEATVRAASTNQYDWANPSQKAVYDPETGTYKDEFTGTLGGKVYRSTDRPVQNMVDERGNSVSATRGPANQGWVTKGAALPDESKYINGSAEPPTEGAFAGGVADSEEAMPVIRDAKMLNDRAKTGSEVAENEAQRRAYDADAALKAAEAKVVGANIPPGATRIMASGGKITAPQTASQSGSVRGGNKPMATKDIVAQARANALASVPKPRLNEWDPKASEKLSAWQAEYDKKFESELERIGDMASGAPSVGDAEPDNDYGARKPPAPSKGKSTESSITLGKDAGGYKKGARVKVRVYEDGSVDILGPAGK